MKEEPIVPEIDPYPFEMGPAGRCIYCRRAIASGAPHAPGCAAPSAQPPAPTLYFEPLPQPRPRAPAGPGAVKRGDVLARKQRAGLIFALRSNGAGFPEIARLLGVTSQRVFQISSDTDRRIFGLADAWQQRIADRAVARQDAAELRAVLPKIRGRALASAVGAMVDRLERPRVWR